MAHTVHLPDGHVVSDDRARLDMAFVLASLDGVYWATGVKRSGAIRPKTMRRSVQASTYPPAPFLSGLNATFT